MQMVYLFLEGGEIDCTCSGIRPAIVSALHNRSSIDIFSYFKKRTLDINPSPLTYGLYACENVENVEPSLRLSPGKS